MSSQQLAILVLICTRTLLDVIVTCSGGPGSKADMLRIANTRAMLDDYIRLVQVEDPNDLQEAMGRFEI